MEYEQILDFSEDVKTYLYMISKMGVVYAPYMPLFHCVIVKDENNTVLSKEFLELKNKVINLYNFWKDNLHNDIINLSLGEEYLKKYKNFDFDITFFQDDSIEIRMSNSKRKIFTSKKTISGLTDFNKMFDIIFIEMLTELKLIK